jgi:hypothetical protein
MGAELMGYRGGELADLADPLERGIRRFASDATRDVGRHLRRRVRHHTPVAQETRAVRASYDSLDDWIRARGGRQPGELRDSWKVGEVEVKFEAGGEHRRIEVYTLDPVAPYVEWPTRPHVIVPRKPGGVLTIPTPAGMVFATVVHHPGTEGAHMMATALTEVAADWRAIVARQWANETRAARFWRGSVS